MNSNTTEESVELPNDAVTCLVPVDINQWLRHHWRWKSGVIINKLTTGSQWYLNLMKVNVNYNLGSKRDQQTNFRDDKRSKEVGQNILWEANASYGIYWVSTSKQARGSISSNPLYCLTPMNQIWFLPAYIFNKNHPKRTFYLVHWNTALRWIEKEPNGDNSGAKICFDGY